MDARHHRRPSPQPPTTAVKRTVLFVLAITSLAICWFAGRRLGAAAAVVVVYEH